MDAVALTPNGQHIISGIADKRVKLWSVATKSLVSAADAPAAVFSRWRAAAKASASSAAA